MDACASSDKQQVGCTKAVYCYCDANGVRWIHINNIWDRIEKAVYLCIDGFLNFYFMRVVKANLIKNGLEKYGRLVQFNQHMIVISLLMDVMIIAAMWIPNGFV